MRHIRAYLALTLMLLAMGPAAFAASTFTVAIQSGSTFRITRTGNTTVSETIDWRVVSLSAIAGVHFTGYQGNYSGQVTFAANETYKDVPISESNPGDDAYKYQNGTDRSYRFEVLDRNGDILASCDRSRNYGTSVPSSGLFSEKTGTIQSSEFWIDDHGYKQTNNPHTINRSSFYTDAAKNYLVFLGVPLHMTLELQAKEEDDAYEYLQVLIDNTTGCDSENDADKGNPGTPSLSRYMAGFEMHPSSTYDTYQTYTFPVPNVADGEKATNPWGYGTNFPLSMQKFKNGCRSTDYKIIVPNSFNTITVRFDASGSKGTDKWWIRNLKAKLTAVDGTAPTVQNNYKVSGGRHQKGNTVYVSVPFSEIVIVSGTPTLASNWGTLSYIAGSGSNVLTFKGTIDPTDNNAFSVSSYSLNGGTIKDLAGNSFNGSISHSFGTALDSDYTWSTSDFNFLAANTYEIYTTQDLRHLALLVNVAKNPCSDLTFKQTQDITCDDTYIPIGIENYYFKGTYDGQGYTVSGITVTRTGRTDADKRLGLFGKIWNPGTVQNVVLANSTFTGYEMIGGIVGYNYGTVRNCRVEGSVIIKAGYNSAAYHGGIVGLNTAGTIIGCISAASIQNNGKSNHIHCGGIVGYTNGGTIKDCLYTGSTVEATDKEGAIVGYNEGTQILTNNYYTAINLGGVGAEGSSSDQDGARRARTVTLGTNVTLSGAQTAYSASGLTAIGTTALQSGTAIYSGEGQTLTLTHADREGYNFDSYTATAGTVEGSTLTMPASDVAVSANYAAFPWSGSGTAADPWVILYPSQLDLLATRVNGGQSYSQKFFKLGADIAYDPDDLNENGENYTPIGTVDKDICFYGTFDGDGHTVSGIRINNNKLYQGLFGHIENNSVVKNLTLANTVITAGSESGGIVGHSNYGTIENCHVESNVSILAYNDGVQSLGGIAGDNSGYIVGSTSSAFVSNNGKTGCVYYGGIAGKSKTVYHCLALSANISVPSYKGTITASDKTGFNLQYNYYLSCTVNGIENASDVGYKTGDLTDRDGAVRAIACDTKPAEIGAQLDSYPFDGLIAYEHGIYYKGVYYLRHDLAGTAATLPLVQGTKDGVTAWWGTFYDSTAAYTLNKGAAAYTMDADYQLYRLGTDGRTIPAGTPVVILSTTPEATIIPAGSATATDHAPGGNILIGVDADTAFPSVYVLSVNNGEVGLRLLASGNLPAHKAGYTTEGTGIQNYDKQGKQNW